MIDIAQTIQLAWLEGVSLYISSGYHPVTDAWNKVALDLSRGLKRCLTLGIVLAMNSHLLISPYENAKEAA